jgi:ABC-2 type transport system ATP-binding protein
MLPGHKAPAESPDFRALNRDNQPSVHEEGMEPIIETRDLTKEYGDTIAVDHISLSVPKGALFGLLGPNGSGKTTMIKMLTGQTRVTTGSASVLGIDVMADPVGVRSLVGIIPEQETPPSFLTSEEYLFFVGAIRKIPDIAEAASWWFRFLDFEDKRDVLCKDLSRGTRQKLMLAQAFLHRPVLALIDEPLINFDPVMQKKVKEFFVSYVKDGGTIFISTHILEIAEEICTEFAILDRGKLLYKGTIEELTERKQHLSEFFFSRLLEESHV